MTGVQTCALPICYELGEGGVEEDPAEHLWEGDTALAHLWDRAIGRRRTRVVCMGSDGGHRGGDTEEAECHEGGEESPTHVATPFLFSVDGHEPCLTSLTPCAPQEFPIAPTGVLASHESTERDQESGG